MILIYCEGTNGQVALPETLVNGNPRPVRRYDIADHYIAVEAAQDDLAWHDARALLALPGFRLATPEEQSAYTASQQKKGAVQESKSAPTPKQKANGG